MATNPRGVYVTRRPYLLGDYVPSCAPGEVIVDLYGDGSTVMCVPNTPDVVSQIVGTGGRILGYAGGGPTPGVTVTPPPPTAGAPPPVPVSAAPPSSIIQTLEHTTGLSGSSLAIGMVILLLLTRKR